MPERSLAPRGLHAWQQDDQLVVGLGDSIDDVQASGRWIKTTHPVEVEARTRRGKPSGSIRC